MFLVLHKFIKRKFVYFVRRYIKKMAWGKWVALVGGIIAVIGQFWGAGYYLPAIGGVVAVVGALGSK
jgi:hypothetical protein